MPTKILFVESYPHVIAGQQRTILSLLECAVRQQVETCVLVPGPGPFVDEAKRRGHEVDIQPYPEKLSRYGGAIYRDGLRNRFRTLTAWWRYVGACRKKLRSHRPNAVFCNDMRGLLTVGTAARSLGIPVVIWDKLDKPHGMLDWFQLPIANKNVIISEAVLKKYPRWQRWWYQKKISTIPNGAELSRFDNLPAAREKFGLTSDKIVIGLIGTVTHRKGHDRLLAVLPELIKKFPKLHILCVGSWVDDEADKSFYESLPNRDLDCVEFLGQRDDVPEIMNSLDVLVVPSRHEGMGQVTVEAMACRKPVIGSDVGGIPEVVVDGETGLIFKESNGPSLADCISRLAESSELRERMGSAGRVRVEKFYDRQKQMSKVCSLLLESR